MSVPEPPWSVSFTDGSNNSYHVTAVAGGVSFVYTPITPKWSSSGVYSGGPPRQGTLSGEQVAELWRALDAITTRGGSPPEHRTKGTAILTTEVAGQTSSRLVGHSHIRVTFERWLAALG